jgi:hypothetical protein
MSVVQEDCDIDDVFESEVVVVCEMVWDSMANGDWVTDGGADGEKEGEAAMDKIVKLSMIVMVIQLRRE